MQNYDVMVSRICESSGLGKEEVERRIEAKKQKLSGLISREGAAQIIAAELGISFEEANFKIAELMPGMKKTNIVGKVINLFPIREYDKNGKSGRVANLIVADETGSTRLVLWDITHISLVENGDIKVGDVIEVRSGSTRENEIHLGSFSQIKKSSLIIDNVKIKSISSQKNLEEVRQGDSVKVRGIVVQIFQPRFYSVCPECNKKVVMQGELYNCLEHGVVKAKDRAILNFVIDDSTDNMRVVAFSEQINLLISEEDLKDSDKAISFRDDFLGTEVYVSGIVKRNQLFNNLEIIANDISKVDVDKLVEDLEKNS